MDTPKAGFCTLCGSEIESFDGMDCCPNCGTTGVPCAYENQVQVSVNLHELRLLCIWAENWGNSKCGGADVVYAIANRLRKQLPESARTRSLTMRDEMAELKEAKYDFKTNHPAADTPELGEHYDPDLGGPA